MICQDDVLFARNVRQYVESHPWPEDRAYLNLVTYPSNECGQAEIDPTFHTPDQPWFEGTGANPWQFHPSNRRGKGAQCLVMDRACITSLLTSIQFFARRFETSMDAKGRRKGTRNVDGAICEALRLPGFTEYVHTPSLATHDCDAPSSMMNQTQPVIRSFVGEGFDAMSMTS